jgi:predicted porin
MQKKLIAVAVAGALGVPAVAFAQTSTVTISGRAYMEYGYVNTGAPRAGGAGTEIINVDSLQTPGSNISFQGEEKLGGNLSAWFKCESTADWRGRDSGDGWCQRNSAVGLKGNFGNVFLGNWDTPFKRARVTTGSNETGHFGTSTLLTGHSTTTADGANAGLFARRNNNLITYDSPNFSGFQVMVAYDAINSQTATPITAVAQKPRIWSLGGKYENGPLLITAAYEKHSEFYTSGLNTGDEKGWLIGAQYTFGGNIALGGMWTEQKADNGSGGSAKVSAWQIGVDWKVSGPHSVKAAYTNAGDMKGPVGFSMGRRPLNGNDSGAYMFQARYFYAFSKRTDFSVGFNHLKNDDNAGYRINAIGSSGAGGQIGAKHTAYAMAIDHRF